MLDKTQLECIDHLMLINYGRESKPKDNNHFEMYKCMK